MKTNMSSIYISINEPEIELNYPLTVRTIFTFQAVIYFHQRQMDMHY